MGTSEGQCDDDGCRTAPEQARPEFLMSVPKVSSRSATLSFVVCWYQEYRVKCTETTAVLSNENPPVVLPVKVAGIYTPPLSGRGKIVGSIIHTPHTT